MTVNKFLIMAPYNINGEDFKKFLRRILNIHTTFLKPFLGLSLPLLLLKILLEF